MMLIVMRLFIIVNVSRNRCSCVGRCELMIVSMVMVNVMFVVVGIV